MRECGSFYHCLSGSVWAKGWGIGKALPERGAMGGTGWVAGVTIISEGWAVVRSQTGLS
jgi:hypothetical protein